MVLLFLLWHDYFKSYSRKTPWSSSVIILTFLPLWGHFLPDPKIISVKIVYLVRRYQMLLIACLYFASFLKSPGGGYPPPAVGKKLAQTPVGARVNIHTGPQGPRLHNPSDFARLCEICLSSETSREGIIDHIHHSFLIHLHITSPT